MLPEDCTNCEKKCSAKDDLDKNMPLIAFDIRSDSVCQLNLGAKGVNELGLEIIDNPTQYMMTLRDKIESLEAKLEEHISKLDIDFQVEVQDEFDNCRFMCDSLQLIIPDTSEPA